jgi:hypothetical protein
VIGVEFGQSIVRVDPGDQFGVGDAESVVERTVDARGHEFVFAFEARPHGVLPFYDFELKAGTHGDFDGGAGDFAVAHDGVAVTKMEERAGNIYGRIKRVAGGDFRRIHVAAKFRRNNRTARLAGRRSYADAPKEWTEKNFGLVGRVERLECGGAGGVVDGVEHIFSGSGAWKPGAKAPIHPIWNGWLSEEVSDTTLEQCK